MCIFSLCQFSGFTKLYTGTCILGMSIVNMYILSMGRVHILKKYFLVGSSILLVAVFLLLLMITGHNLKLSTS